MNEKQPTAEKVASTFNNQEVNLDNQESRDITLIHNINRHENCGKNKEINRTLVSTTPKYNLKAQMDQLTNVESRVYSLMAQLDLLTNL